MIFGDNGRIRAFSRSDYLDKFDIFQLVANIHLFNA